MSKSSVSAIFCAAILFSIGLVMVFNTTAAEALDRSLHVNANYAIIKQLLYAVTGVFLAIFFWFFGYQNVIRISPLLLFITTVLLICVFLPQTGLQINGANRWLSLGGYTFQPSEVAKYTLPIYFIYRFIEKKEHLYFLDFLKILLLISIPVILIFFEPDNGTCAIITVTFIALFVLTKVRLKYWAWPLIILVLLGGFVAYNMPHVPDRINTYLHPEQDLRGKGHQPHQAKIAAGSGQMFGRGLGESLQKFNYLPEARSDYIAAIYAEEFGFVGILFLICLYMVIACSGFVIASQAVDREGYYLASVITFLISFQAFLNLGVVSGLLPSKGTTLPFFSLGGSSLLINILALCILVNIAYKAKKNQMIYGKKKSSYQRRGNKRPYFSR